MTAFDAFTKPIPEGIDLTNEWGDPVIVRRWYTSFVWFYLVFAIFWDSFLIVWYSVAITKHEMSALLFPLLHVAAGVYITYFTFCTFFNKTRICIGENGVTIVTSPLPWPGNKTVERGDLNGFLVRESNRNKNYRSFKIIAISRDNREKTLYSGFFDQAQAEYVADYLRYYYKVG